MSTLITLKCTSLEESASPNTNEVPLRLMKPSLFKDHLCRWQGSAGLASRVLRTWRLKCKNKIEWRGLIMSIPDKSVWMTYMWTVNIKKAGKRAKHGQRLDLLTIVNLLDNWNFCADPCQALSDEITCFWFHDTFVKSIGQSLHDALGLCQKSLICVTLLFFHACDSVNVTMFLSSFAWLLTCLG